MCDCIVQIEKKSFESVREQKEGEFAKGNLTPSSFPIIDNKFKGRRTHSEYKFAFAPKKKDGTLGKPKTQSVNILHSYCPFCGEKHNNE